MKKQLSFLFLLFVSALSFAQSSLDSLRLVLPVGHTTYISNILSIPKTENDNSKLITSDGEVNCVWDYSTKKLLHSFFTRPNDSGLLYSSKFIINVDSDTLYVRRVKDGSIYYKMDISSSEFKTDWSNETVNEIKLSIDEKSVIVVYLNYKKNIWKVNVYDLNRGSINNSFSGQVFDHFKIHTIPNLNFILAEVDNSILRLEYGQDNKSNKLVEFENNIKSIQNIKGTEYLHIQVDENVILYDLIKGIKKSEIEGEFAYFKDSILVTINQNELKVSNVLSNEPIVNTKLKKLYFESGEYIEPTILFSPKVNFIIIQNGDELLSIKTSTKEITKEKLSEELFVRYISDFGYLIVEEPLFKCLLQYDLFSKETKEIFCPNQFDGNGEVNFPTIIYEDPNMAYLYFGGFRQTVQFDLKKMKLVGEYKPQISTVASIQFDPNSENIIIQGYTDIKQLPIDLSAEGKIIENINFWCNGDPISFNSTSDKIAIPSRQSLALIFSYPEFRPIQEIEMSDYPGTLKFSRNDNYLISSSSIIDLATSEIIFNSDNELWIDSKETLIIEKDYNSDVSKIRDVKSLGLISEGRFGDSFDILDYQIFIDNNFEQFVFITNDRKMLYANSHFPSKSFLVENWKLKKNNKVIRVQFTDSIIVLITTDKAHIFGLRSKAWIKDLDISETVKGHIEISPNGKFICYLDNSNSLLLFDLETNKQIYKYTQLENNNWLVKLPNSPYYMCSKDASKMLHYVTPSLKVIGFEQLDPVYNRPDIVLDSIGKYFGGADQELVANYRQSWEKRIDRLGLDKEKLGKGEIAVPNAEIVDADNIAFENKAGKLDITVSANDSKYALRRFNVFVNEVPLYGSAGISIAHLKKQVWDTTVSVPLSLGENKIQVSVMNELGLENFKYPTYVNYTPDKEIVAKTHYIGIGVNEFKDTEHNLKYCVKDVTDLAKSFGGANTEVKLFTDKQVNKENILALKEYLNKTSVNDKVIISCSSHGLLDDSLNFYLAMHDVDFNNPKARGLKYEALESLLDGIPARQKLLLLDACNSGENDKTEVLKKELAQAETQKETSELAEYKNKTKGVIIKLEEENKSNFKKMNELFVNVRNNTGSVIISAAGGQESALEAISVDGKTIENGAFTYSILECLKQNEGKELKVNALKQYAEKRVEEITNGKQKPTSRQETMEVDWGVR